MQVVFPARLQKAGVPGQQLEAVIKDCLKPQPEGRPTAGQLQDRLYAIVQQHGWSDDLNDVAS